MHSFRHTVASRALLAGESVDEVAFLLGHRDATVTRTVYVREIADARRRALRRSRMVDEYGGVLRTALNSCWGVMTSRPLTRRLRSRRARPAALPVRRSELEGRLRPRSMVAARTGAFRLLRDLESCRRAR